ATGCGASCTRGSPGAPASTRRRRSRRSSSGSAMRRPRGPTRRRRSTPSCGAGCASTISSVPSGASPHSCARRLRDRPRHRGPIFGNVVLADEVNRAPAKTQSALLEAMQERQVTLEGAAQPLPDPFLVLATQNPVEYEGTYPLPEAQLDRFLFKAVVRYPEP